MQALGASTLTSWWEMNISKATSKGKEAVGEINLIAFSASGRPSHEPILPLPTS